MIFMIQALAGPMSITGEGRRTTDKLAWPSPTSPPDVRRNAILAALYSRERTGKGDRIDVSLFDSTIAWLANVGSNYLVSGTVPHRQGTAPPQYRSLPGLPGGGRIADHRRRE